MDRVCETCGSLFTTRDRRKRRCRPDCRNTNAARARTRAAHDVAFVGVDGEGVTDAFGRHTYVLLSVGEESLHLGGAELTHEEIFPFLYDCFLTDPTAAYVGFYLGYDFTMWLKSLPEERARMLLTDEGIKKRARHSSGGNATPFPVEVRIDGVVYELDYLEKRRLKIRRDGGKWMYICDAGPFFQTSFLKACDPSKATHPVCSDDEYAVIVEGKSARSTAQFDPSMIRYNTMENRILARLMSQLNRGLVDIGIKLTRKQWFGPGQAATAWMNLIGAPESSEIIDVTPDEVLEAAVASYYGGWFEITAHGPIPGPLYEYDINSAYPARIATLPCLLHGEWKQEQGHGATLELVHATVTVAPGYAVGPMVHRTSKGSVLRPLTSAGWVWADELRASLSMYHPDDVTCDIDDAWSYYGCDCPPPFAAIADVYEDRKRIGKNTPEGVARKLIINSVYGKLAQSVGNPRHASAIYASLITSACRAQMASAIATHPTGHLDVVMIATDGIYFRSPHPSLDIDPTRLGAWDESTKSNVTLFKPGVYWSDDARTRVRNAGLKSRGISASDLARVIDRIDDAFRRTDDWPSITIPVAFSMTSAKSALHRGKWQTAGHITVGGTRSDSADPRLKRMYVGKDAEGIRRSAPWPQSLELESTPYAKTFGIEWEDEQWDEFSDDGELRMELHEWLY